MGSLSLYAGGRLRGWQAYLLPLLLMAATDPLVGGYSFATPFIYFSFLINVWIGSRLRSTESPWRIVAAVVVASIQFFLISNFGAWLGSFATYPHTLGGLVSCYIAAIPFYGSDAGRPTCCIRPLCSACTPGSAARWPAPNAWRRKPPSVKTLLAWSSGKDSSWTLQRVGGRMSKLEHC